MCVREGHRQKHGRERERGKECVNMRQFDFSQLCHVFCDSRRAACVSFPSVWGVLTPQCCPSTYMWQTHWSIFFFILSLCTCLSLWLKWSSEVVNEKNIYKEYILWLATNKAIARGQESWGSKDASWSMLRPAGYSSLTCQANNCKYGQLSLCLSWCISKLFKFVLPLREKICCRLKQPCRKLTSGCHMDLDFWLRYTERSSTLRLAGDPNSGIHHPSSRWKSSMQHSFLDQALIGVDQLIGLNNV